MKPFEYVFGILLSERTKKQTEKVILTIAIFSFLVHLILIFMVDAGWLKSRSELLDNPIAAVYTPFSFILIYEVYLLIYYLPKSITTYIGKQYEIITLIIIRRLFKDLANLKLSSNWFELQDDLQFTYDLVASAVLFFLIYLFYVQSLKRRQLLVPETGKVTNIQRFIDLKKAVATLLVPVLLVTAVYYFALWVFTAMGITDTSGISFKSINNVFFDEFFTILIVVDVILLLASFYYSDQFHKVIRNSGFVISTILIRLSFSVEGALNTILIVTAIFFGLLMLLIHNLFEKQINKGAT
ncbi:hypothetical protein [Robiginitalea sp.]|uniref:hypothetical protein n=1 Tax=Robiginitalea sp. TaxID=1902411 RepID=UPI003C749C55